MWPEEEAGTAGPQRDPQSVITAPGACCEVSREGCRFTGTSGLITTVAISVQRLLRQSKDAPARDREVPVLSGGTERGPPPGKSAVWRALSTTLEPWRGDPHSVSAHGGQLLAPADGHPVHVCVCRGLLC